MADILVILVDGQPHYEFDREKTLPDAHSVQLQQMDRKMDQGFDLQGEFLASPDLKARTRFVAGSLATALASDQENLAMALTTWLGVRCPDLKQVRITPGELGMEVDLDYENAYQKPAPEPQVVQFHPTKH